MASGKGTRRAHTVTTVGALCSHSGGQPKMERAFIQSPYSSFSPRTPLSGGDIPGTANATVSEISDMRNSQWTFLRSPGNPRDSTPQWPWDLSTVCSLSLFVTN